MPPVRALALVLLALSPTPSPAEEPQTEPGPWNSLGDEDGITARRRKVPGSSLAEFQGTGVVDAPLARVLAALVDIAHRNEWSNRCMTSHIIKQVTEESQIFYDRTKGSWPVSDRDVILKADVTVDTAQHLVRIDFVNTTHPEGPVVDGAVRMPSLHGHWFMRPVQGGNATAVEYQVFADPGGSIPAWLSNLVSKQLPFKTIAGLRTQVKKPRYDDASKQFMTRPDYAALVNVSN
jgi:hypothetical protein